MAEKIYNFRYESASNSISEKIFETIPAPPDAMSIIPPGLHVSSYIFMKRTDTDDDNPPVEYLHKDTFGKINTLMNIGDECIFEAWYETDNKAAFASHCRDAVSKYMIEQQSKIEAMNRKIEASQKILDNLEKYNKDTFEYLYHFKRSANGFITSRPIAITKIENNVYYLADSKTVNKDEIDYLKIRNSGSPHATYSMYCKTENPGTFTEAIKTENHLRINALKDQISLIETDNKVLTDIVERTNNDQTS